MKRFSIIFVGLLLLLATSNIFIQADISQLTKSVSSKPSVEMAVTSPEPDSTVNGDFYVTGIASDRKEDIEGIDVTFTSLFDKEQTPIKQYQARYSQEGKWSTHVKQGDLPDDTYAVMVTVHTNEGNKRYLFSTVVVDSSLSSKVSTF